LRGATLIHWKHVNTHHAASIGVTPACRTCVPTPANTPRPLLPLLRLLLLLQLACQRSAQCRLVLARRLAAAASGGCRRWRSAAAVAAAGTCWLAWWCRTPFGTRCQRATSGRRHRHSRCVESRAARCCCRWLLAEGWWPRPSPLLALAAARQLSRLRSLGLLCWRTSAAACLRLPTLLLLLQCALLLLLLLLWLALKLLLRLVALGLLLLLWWAAGLACLLHPLLCWLLLPRLRGASACRPVWLLPAELRHQHTLLLLLDGPGCRCTRLLLLLQALLEGHSKLFRRRLLLGAAACSASCSCRRRC
jgi:hypothetical protein